LPWRGPRAGRAHDARRAAGPALAPAAAAPDTGIREGRAARLVARAFLRCATSARAHGADKRKRADRSARSCRADVVQLLAARRRARPAPTRARAIRANDEGSGTSVTSLISFLWMHTSGVGRFFSPSRDRVGAPTASLRTLPGTVAFSERTRLGSSRGKAVGRSPEATSAISPATAASAIRPHLEGRHRQLRPANSRGRSPRTRRGQARRLTPLCSIRGQRRGTRPARGTITR
jgi:hypothetical protein